jgi:hypothetical protein
MAAAEEDILFSNAAMTDDALDRRAALDGAIQVTSGSGNWFSREHDNVIITRAEEFYAWLRQRDTLRVVLAISAGTPEDQPAGQTGA